MTRKLIVAALALGLAGCGAGGAIVPQDNFYRLDAKADMSLAQPAVQGAVEVERFVADGSYAKRPILYTSADNPQLLREYHYHMWIEQPPLLLRDTLAAYLRQAGVAAQVVTPEMRIRADYTVMARIRRLEVIEGSTPKAIAAFALGLRDERADAMDVLGEYSAEVPAANGSAGAGVAALNQAINDCFKAFAADMVKN